MTAISAEGTVVNVVSSLEIGRRAVVGNLALVPLLLRDSAQPRRSPGYLLYQEAQRMGLISIEQVSEAGAVGELRVINLAGQPILLVEGEVLLGMKQTRVLNLTI